MAWRIDEAVTHGVIDNTVEGRTSGRIWLAGRSDPLELSLDGDCWRDLAGTRLRFRNPQPKETRESGQLDANQEGIVGDMTASRRCRISLLDQDGTHHADDNGGRTPFEWRNTLYLEWFSRSNGRVLVESSGFELQISGHEWEMDGDAEEAQKLANLNSMRDFMAQVIKRRETGEDHDQEGELDEFAWEQRLRESDRLTDAYQEVIEKYMDDPDSERKEAFVMGWDGLLDALADRDEEFDEGSAGDPEDFGEVDEDEDDGLEEIEAFSGEGDEHPLQARAQALSMLAMDLVEREAGPGSPAYVLVSSLLQVSGKLAGALNGRGSGYEPETGYVLAILKRCLSWLNESVGACQELMAGEEDPDQLAALAHVRSSCFEVRDRITELRRELKS